MSNDAYSSLAEDKVSLSLSSTSTASHRSNSFQGSEDDDDLDIDEQLTGTKRFKSKKVNKLSREKNARLLEQETPSTQPLSSNLSSTTSSVARSASRRELDSHHGSSASANEQDKDTWRWYHYFVFSPALWAYFLQHCWREMRKRKFNYCLGLFSCFLVVCIAAICYTMIARAPVVFLQQAESNNGQVDLRLTPSSATYSSFFNYSQFTSNVMVNPDYSFHAPRLTLAHSSVYKMSDCPSSLQLAQPSLTDPTWKYIGIENSDATPGCDNRTVTCLNSLCQARATDVPFHAIDTEKEKRMGYGRDWPFEPLEDGEAVITIDLANAVGVGKGDTIMVYVHTYDLIRGLVSQSMLSSSSQLAINVTELLDQVVSRVADVTFLTFTVKDVISDTKGKFETNTDPRIIVEGTHLHSMIVQNLHPILKQKNLDVLCNFLGISNSFLYNTTVIYNNNTIGTNSSSTNTTIIRTRLFPDLTQSLLDRLSVYGGASIFEYSTEINVNLPPPRISFYIDTDFDHIQANCVQWSSRVIYYSNFGQVDSKMGILSDLYDLRFFSLYLGLILSVILTILFLLSILLIYSLLMISVETRTFELGVHRMCGMTRVNIVKMLLVQACSYSIPAWVIGLIVSQIAAYVILDSLEKSVEVPIDKHLDKVGIGVATGLGLVIPLLAAVLPILTALSKNLHDSLDTQHSKTLGVQFNIERSEDSSVNYAWLAVGFGLTIIGFLIYYLLPLALLSFNLTLFFNVFFSLLLGMLFGLIMLALNFQHVLERLIVFVFFFWEKTQIPFLVVKNLIAHRLRNRKTSIMYALSIAFILFIVSAYQLEIWTAKARQLKNQGAHMALTGTRSYNFLPAYAVKDVEAYLKSNPCIHDFAWITAMLGSLGEWDDLSVANLGHVYNFPAQVYGISSNFYDVALNEFLVIAERDTNDGLSLSEQLYTTRGSQGGILGSASRQQFGLSSTDPAESYIIAMQNRIPAELEIHRLRAMSLLDNSPKLGFTRFPPTGSRPTPVAVSFSTYIRLSAGRFRSIRDLPMWSLMLSLQTCSASNKDRLVSYLKNLGAQHDMTLYDSRDFSAQLEKSNNVMTLIFSTATYIAMGLCLFSLMASMFTNIYEQSKEIAITRAIGLTTWEIIRIFTYEAFVLVFAASLLGVCIGLIMSFTLVAQRILFTQLPVPYFFPWQFILVVIIGSVICAVVASLFPTKELMKKPIATIMKTVL